MGEIFEKATMTFVWLGMTDESSQSAFDLIETLTHCKLTLTEALNSPKKKKENQSRLKDFLSSQGLESEREESRWAAIYKVSEDAMVLSPVDLPRNCYLQECCIFVRRILLYS